MIIKTISDEDYYKLVGLLQLAHDANIYMKKLTDSIASVVEEEADEHGYYGHVDDAVWGLEYSAGELLKKLGIKRDSLETNHHRWEDEGGNI